MRIARPNRRVSNPQAFEQNAFAVGFARNMGGLHFGHAGAPISDVKIFAATYRWIAEIANVDRNIASGGKVA